MIRSLLSLSAISLTTFALACSDDGTNPPGDGDGDFATGGIGSGTGGAGSGGITGGTGAAPGTGSMPGTGGEVAGTGGDVAGTGGSDPGGTGFVCPTGSDALVLDLTGKMAMPVAGVTPPDNGFTFTEGPVWFDGALYFSQIYGNNNEGPQPGRIMKYTPGGGIAEFNPGANEGTNGLAVNGAGLLVAASQKATGIVSFDPKNPTAAGVTLTDSYEAKPFNSPNDLTIRADGNIYFTDPKWQCKPPCGQGDLEKAYRLSPGGVPERLTQVTHIPNGIALSPDGNTLYVGGNSLKAYPVMLDGSVGGEQNFGDLTQSTDGLGVDCAGNVYVTSGGAVHVFDKTGTRLGTIPGIESVTNVAFGGSNNTTLFITNQIQNQNDEKSQLMSVELNVPGFPY